MNDHEIIAQNQVDLTFQMPVNPTIITITDENGKELVRLERDGTVIMDEDKKTEAALIFWAAVTGLNPLLLQDHIKKLEAEIASLKNK